MKRRIAVTLMVLCTSMALFAGCQKAVSSNAPVEAPVAEAPATEAPATAAPAPAAEAPAPAYVSADPNIIVDMEKKEVTVVTEVNAKYFTEPTRHGVVFKDGSNGEKAVLRGLGSQFEFYNALEAVGFVPSNKLTMEDMKKAVSVEGEALDVFVSWEGSNGEIPFADIIKASEERTMDVRFGGNLENAKAKNTGCILCLDSCAVGITSNASYETGASESIQFFGKDDVLPADGTKVNVIFKKRA